MYKKGDYIVYGNAGAYKVSDITTLSGVSYADKNTSYYVLKPVFSSGVVYYPVNSQKIFTRPVITKESVEALIKQIPEISVEVKEFSNLAELSDYYKQKFQNHTCRSLIELLLFIEKKKQQLAEQNKRLGQVDETNLKAAQELLYAEFAVALNIDISEVEGYIQGKIK